MFSEEQHVHTRQTARGRPLGPPHPQKTPLLTDGCQAQGKPRTFLAKPPVEHSRTLDPPNRSRLRMVNRNHRPWPILGLKKDLPFGGHDLTWGTWDGSRSPISSHRRTAAPRGTPAPSTQGLLDLARLEGVRTDRTDFRRLPERSGSVSSVGQSACRMSKEPTDRLGKGTSFESIQT